MTGSLRNLNQQMHSREAASRSCLESAQLSEDLPYLNPFLPPDNCRHPRALSYAIRSLRGRFRSNPVVRLPQCGQANNSPLDSCTRGKAIPLESDCPHLVSEP